MKFNELKLLVAIHRCQPKGDPVSDRDRMRYAVEIRDVYTRMFGDVFFPWTVTEVVENGVLWRKNTTTRIKAEIADAHGYHCFWAERGKGQCSDEVEAGHVIARSTGAELTVANGMIECHSHNNQRSDRTIEEYLASQDRTVDVGAE